MEGKKSGNPGLDSEGVSHENNSVEPSPLIKRRKLHSPHSSSSSSSDDYSSSRQAIERKDAVCGGDSLQEEYKDEEEDENDILTIDSLFDELLQKIFSYFPAPEVFGVLSKVCVRWERVAKDPDTLGQCQLFLDGSDDKYKDMCIDLLREASSVGEVYISPFYPQEALPHLINGPKVRKLVIIGDSDWHRIWPSAGDLIALLEHNKDTLQQLSMYIESGLVNWHKVPHVSAPSFQSLIAGMKRLTHLHLMGECWRSWDEWDFSEYHPRLHTLKIDSLSFISDECPFIRDLISLCKPTLRTLYLPCQLPDDAISLINAGVFYGSLVENLMVSTGCLRVISQMRHLKILAVADNGKEDRDLRWFKESPMLSGVIKLTLQSIVETEKEGLVWHLLSRFNNVEEFWGIESSVEEDTFNMFLKNNPSLKEVHFLDFNGFESPSQVQILEKFLPNLTVIDVALSQISEEVHSALKSLSERRPCIKISYGDDFDEVSDDI